jgi:hypothetical protein
MGTRAIDTDGVYEFLLVHGQLRRRGADDRRPERYPLIGLEEQRYAESHCR